MKKAILLIMVVCMVLAAQFSTYKGTSGNNSARVEKLTEKEVADYDAAVASVRRASDNFSQITKAINRSHHVAECPTEVFAVSALCKPEYASIHGEWLVIDGN